MELNFRVNKDRGPDPSPAWDEIGDEVSVEGAICQAAQAIDMAGKIAAETESADQLLQVGEHFRKLADFIISVSEYQQKREESKSGQPMGFQIKGKEEE